MSFFSNPTVRLVTRRFWGLVFTIVIAFAVLVQLGREAFPLLSEYTQEISERLGEQLGVKISIGELHAEWEGMRPQLDLINVIIESLDGEDIFKIKNARAEINLLDSVLNRKIYWQRISLQDTQAKAWQDDNKAWHIQGLSTTANTERNLNVDDPLDVFLFGRRVEIKALNLDIEYRDGRVSHLFVPVVNLENDRNFHRIEASLQIDENADAFQLMVEGHGDPRDAGAFSAKGYMALKDFPLEKVVAALGLEAPGEDGSSRWGDDQKLDLQLWLAGSRTSGISAKGFLEVDGLPIRLPQAFISPTNLQAEVHASWHYKKTWQITLKDMQIHWPEFSATPLNAKLYQHQNEAPGLAIDRVSIDDWMSWLNRAGLTETRVGEILASLAPSGEMENIDLKFLANTDEKFKLRANLKNISVEEFRGSPGVSSVNAFMQASANQGLVEIRDGENIDLFFPKLYKESFRLDKVSGIVSWQIDKRNQRTWVASNVVRAVSGGEAVSGKFFLGLPFKREHGEPWMTLSLGMESTAAKRYQQFLPFTVPDTLERWLQRSVGEGELRDVAFMYSGTTRKEGELARNIQLLADISQGRIAFDEAWPPLEGVKAHIYLNDKDLDVSVVEANILGNHVASAKITLEEPGDGKLELLINGLIRSNATAAMELLKNSPVRSAIGKTFDTWEVEGDVNAELELTVPLTANTAVQKQDVRVEFSRARLGISDLDLEINEVSGNLFYSSDKGLHTKNLTGRFWGEKVKAIIESPLTAEGARETKIKFNGRVAVEKLRAWTGRAELFFVNGKAPVEGQLIIPANKSSEKKLDIHLQTQLKGIALDLPAPVGKIASSEKPFEVHIELYKEEQFFNFIYDQWIRMQVRRGGSEINSAQILFGDAELEPESGFFDIAGRIGSFDLQEWNTAREKYFEYLQKNKNEGGALPLRFDLHVEHSNFGNFIVEDLQVAGLGTEGDWTLFLDSEFLRGNVIAYDNDRPLFMRLEHLRFPKQEAEEPASEEVAPEDESEVQAPINSSLLAKLDLKKAIPIDFSSKEISFGKENYGAWSFHLRPTEDGVRFENIVADVRGMKIGSKEQPAEFVWSQHEGNNASSFSGQLGTGNLGKVLDAWGQEKLMESTSASMTLTAKWPGAPDEMQLQGVEGLIVLNITDGNFVRGAKAGENPLLRLIALFNFDTLARRLRLDFSDLAKEGFAFDRVHGELHFAEGNIDLKTPLVVDSTSSRMQLTGNVDMIEEKLDTDLIVTLPVASNLAVLTAFSAGLPAGVGVYLVSKLFKKQVDRVSSINYSVTGDWDDPKIRVRKVLKDSEPSDQFEQP